MADEAQIAKNSLDVLIEASELVCKFTAVSKILGIADELTSAFPFVGAVLGLVERVLPDSKHKEILHSFEKLTTKIDQVRNDMTESERMSNSEFKELQYGVLVDRIKLGMRYCLEIGRAAGKDEKMRFQERLKEVCFNQNVSLALNAILDGMIGNGLFRSISILDEFYNKTKGDRQKISALATRLLQLVCGGMMVIATYETVLRGKEGANEMTKLYNSRLKEVYAKVQSVLDRCMENYKENMFNDLNAFLDTGRPNKDLLAEVSDFMRDKYDWLEHFCLVYNDLQGSVKHFSNGHRVESLHRNGKCGIVFYRTKNEPPRFSERCNEALEINEEACKIKSDVSCSDAQEIYKNIVAKLEEKGIGWTGCAVIRRGPDLWFEGTFSTKDATVVGPYATAIILLK